MAIDVATLAKLLDEALSTDIDKAIEKYGSDLSDDQKADLRSLTREEIKNALQNLVEANKGLKKLLWFDNNNNNN